MNRRSYIFNKKKRKNCKKETPRFSAVTDIEVSIIEKGFDNAHHNAKEDLKTKRVIDAVAEEVKLIDSDAEKGIKDLAGLTTLYPTGLSELCGSGKKRKHIRHAAEMSVRCYYNGGEYSASLQNISRKGALLACDGAFQVYRVIKLKIDFQKGSLQNVIEMSGIIRWIGEKEPGEERKIGIEFLEPLSLFNLKY